MSEEKRLTIDSVKEKNGLFIVSAGGTKYGTKEAGIKDFIGKTATFQTAMVDKGKYKNFYINSPLPEVPKDTASNGCIAKEKVMILSYAKDFAGFYSPALSKEEGLNLVEEAYKRMCSIIGIEVTEDQPF